MTHRSLWVLVAWLLLAPQPAPAAPKEQPQMPEPLGYVTDHAAVLDADWKARIRSVSQDLERKTGVEMVIVTVRTIKPYKSVNDYASTIYQRWGIGTAQQDHGVLLLAAVEERQAAITLGRSLLGVVTPPVMEKISSQYIEPSFRNGEFGKGLYQTSVALAAAVQDVRVGAPLRYHLKGFGIFLTVTTGVGSLIFLWWISRPDLRHPYGRIRREEYWGSGQGGFGGNFGGFGGGTSGEGLK